MINHEQINHERYVIPMSVAQGHKHVLCNECGRDDAMWNHFVTLKEEAVQYAADGSLVWNHVTVCDPCVREMVAGVREIKSLVEAESLQSAVENPDDVGRPARKSA